jgi:hypothetical protein
MGMIDNVGWRRQKIKIIVKGLGAIEARSDWME